MKIGVFVYDFEHWKSQQGIQNLILSKNKPEVIFAAPRVELKFYRSKIRTTPKDLFLIHPKKIAEHYGVDYCVVKHNSEETVDLVKKYKLDLGIILGARILKTHVIKAFNKGVLNMHPGILPDNRGLDTIKWAIFNDLPQGVTTHLIDGEIDRGLFVEKDEINIYEDDTLLDLQIRIENLEQKMMLSSIDLIKKNNINKFEKIKKGQYNTSMPKNIEGQLLSKFANYKKEFSNATNS